MKRKRRRRRRIMAKRKTSKMGRIEGVKEEEKVKCTSLPGSKVLQ